MFKEVCGCFLLFVFVQIKLLTQFNEEVDRVGGVTDERRIVVEKKFRYFCFILIIQLSYKFNTRIAEEAMKYHLVFDRVEWEDRT